MPNGNFTIGEIPNRVSQPRRELVGALMEVETLLGPNGTPLGMSLTVEQLADFLGLASYAALSLPDAQALPAATPPGVVPGTLYGITGDWNATGTDATVFVQGVRPDAYHKLGVLYDAQGAGQLVEVDVVAGTYVALAGQAYDDTSIYALARSIRDRVDALDRNVIRWNLPRRVTLVSGGGNPSYESGDAFVVYAASASANGNVFTLAAPDYPRQGDYLGILVQADSLPIMLKGLRFGSPTGPTTLTLPASYQYEVHAATDTVGDITATYWVVHSSPGTNSSTPGTPRDLLDMTPAFLESVMALSYDVNGDAPLASTPAGSFPGQWFNGIDANGDSFRYECGRYRYRSGDTTSAGIGPAWSRQLRLQP